MQEINVIVVDRGRKYLYLRYTDPVTGQKVEKSARTTKKKEAMKRAGEWQTELENGLNSGRTRLKWQLFRDAYEEHVATQLAERSLTTVISSFNVIERTMRPDNIGRITEEWVSRFQNQLLKSGRRPATVESHCRILRAALNWAKDKKWIANVPRIKRLKRAKSAKVMKGRAVTEQEFNRILSAVDALPEKQHESLRFLLEGLWLSGLRLGEALSLTWDQWADGIRVDTSGEFVMLQIPAEAEKGGEDRTYPVTPDFEEFLLSVPPELRDGFVFNPVLYRGVCRRLDSVCKTLSGLGRAAGVKVDQQGDKPIYASAHDLRRAFGARWARLVMPMTLKELMRHESVTTTEKFYVGIEAEATARHLRKVTLQVTPSKSGLVPRGKMPE